MGGSNFGQSHREQDKMNGKVDKAIRQDKDKEFTKTDWRALYNQQKKELLRVKSFTEDYPSFGLWERSLNEIINLDSAIRELTEYHEFPKKPRAVRDWIESEFYKKEFTPVTASIAIKEKLCW